MGVMMRLRTEWRGLSAAVIREGLAAMILEVADLRTTQGNEGAFADALQRGLHTVLRHARGFRSARVLRGIESPQRFVLMIEWDTLEDHTVGFRGGELFALWRAIVGPLFAQPPQVEHFETAVEPIAPPN
jgi:heme-degrading monooxygenase HmoA